MESHSQGKATYFHEDLFWSFHYSTFLDRSIFYPAGKPIEFGYILLGFLWLNTQWIAKK